MTNDQSQARQDLYASARKDLLARQLSNSERYDGAILSLSSALLATSIAFMDKIVPAKAAVCIGLLLTSWWMFGIAIVLTLVSFLISQAAINRQLLFAEEYYLNGKSEYLTKSNPYAKTTVFFNYSSGITFVLAIILTIIFVSINVGKG